MPERRWPEWACPSPGAAVEANVKNFPPGGDVMRGALHKAPVLPVP
jgi:hypothetical protein